MAPRVSRSRTSTATATPTSGGVGVIDATSQFCLATVCPAVVGDVLVYRNSGHITASYMKTMTPWLARQLR